MVDEKIRKRLPPYVSYRTFRNFIDNLQAVVPARIDRSYWGNKLSGSTGTQLMSALIFLNLVDFNATPTAQLRVLASSKDSRRTEVLKQVCNNAYSFLTSQGNFDAQSATYAQLHEMFHYTFQVSGGVARKCIKFYVAMADDAGIPLSPFITKQTRPVHSTTVPKAQTKKSSLRTKNIPTVPQNNDDIGIGTTWDKLLLSKFPAFDPGWPNDVKLKWFEAFDQLLHRSTKT